LLTFIAGCLKSLEMALRIMILVPGFPVQREKIKGGVHAAVQNLLLGFENLDVKLRLVSIDPDLQQDNLVVWNDRVEVQYCAIRKMPAKMLSYLLYGPAIVKRNIAAFKPDIIHYQIGGNFLLTRFGVKKTVPYLLTIHGISLEEAKVNRSVKKKLTMYWNGYITQLLRPRNIINISAYSKTLVNIPDNTNHPIIYNAVAQAFFNIPVKTEMTNRLLYVGVINERKNLMALLEAMAQLKAEGIIYKLSVVGGADLDKGYFDLVQEFASLRIEGQVDFLGWRGQTELLELLGNHDLVVLPSRQETLPMSVAEAMGAGKVVVVSNVGGLPEMVTNGETGFLFDPFNVDELKYILQVLNKNNELVQQVGTSAKAFAQEKFDNHQIALQTLNYYKTILATDRSSV
jgi:glycosyltransferase involved in cell wall biosynthesis